MELTQTVSPRRTRLALVGAAVAITASLVIPTIDRTTATAKHDAVTPITLTTSPTGLAAYARHLEMVQALSRLRLESTTTVCLPCIVRQHRP